MIRRRIWLAVGTAVVLFGCMQGTAMAKMVLWSAVKGRVLMNGKPAAGAVLVRNYSWHWKNEKGSDRTTASASGAFAFPAIEGSSLLGGLLPHEPVIEHGEISGLCEFSFPALGAGLVAACRGHRALSFLG